MSPCVRRVGRQRWGAVAAAYDGVGNAEIAHALEVEVEEELEEVGDVGLVRLERRVEHAPSAQRGGGTRHHSGAVELDAHEGAVPAVKSEEWTSCQERDLVGTKSGLRAARAPLWRWGTGRRTHRVDLLAGAPATAAALK